MGGIGKTQTALEYAYRYAEFYQAIFWVKADSRLALTSSFIEIASLLKLPEKDAQESEQAVSAVMNWLERHEGWLLIFDNADSPELVKPFRPRNAMGHVLLTSRAQLFDRLGISTPIELQTMTADEAVEFLFTRTGRDTSNPAEKAAALKLADELGYLPLALEQAGAYILAKHARFQDYLASYGKQRLKLLQQASPVAGEYPESVLTTWKMNFSEVERASEAAADVLTLCAFLSPDHIPFELIVEGRQQLGPAITAALSDVDENPLLLNEMLAPLMLYSLVRVDSEQRTFSLHRLVQEVVQARLDESARRAWAERAVEALNEALPMVAFETWLSCERLLPHARQAARLIQQWQIVSQSAARLLNQSGVYCYFRGQYKEAESLYKQAVAIFEKALGPDHPEVAQILNNLAELYRNQGKLTDAEPLYKKALDIFEKALGPDHPQVATSLNNLALLYKQQGKLAEAEPLYKQALDISEKALDPNHPNIANRLNNLAMLYHQQGKLADAEPLYKQAIDIFKKALGLQHPTLAVCLENYAGLLRAMHRDDEAEELDNRARAIWQAQ